MSPLTAMSTNFPKAMGMVRLIIDDANNDVIDFAYTIIDAFR